MSEPKFTALGVDVGGTKIAAGVVAFPEGVVRARREIPTLPQRGGAAVLAVDVPSGSSANVSDRIVRPWSTEVSSGRLLTPVIG